VSYPSLCGRAGQSAELEGQKGGTVNPRQFLAIFIVVAILGLAVSLLNLFAPTLFLGGDEDGFADSVLSWGVEIVSQATMLGAMVLPLIFLYWMHAKSKNAAAWNFTAAGRARQRNNAGMALFNQGAYIAAAAEFSEALRLDPKMAAAHYNRANAALRLDKVDEAIADLEAAIGLNPKFANAYVARAEVWHGRNDLDRALADLNVAVDLTPQNAAALANRGGVWLARQEYERAVKDFDKALWFDPKAAAAYSGRGAAWRARGELDRALADFSHAIAFGDTASYAYRASTWLYKGDLDRTIADCTQAAEHQPKNAAVFRDRGLAWLYKGEYHKAIADSDRAIRLDPRDAVTWNNRGTAYLKAGDYVKAVADLNEALRLDPKLPNGYKNLAWLQATCPQAEFRNAAQAVANATRALELAAGKAPDWLGILAAAHAEAGNFEEAVKWQAKLIAELPPEKRPEMQRRLELYQAGQPFRDEAALAAAK
jgi:tetratricopeptide (TPR) repeat protein